MKKRISVSLFVAVFSAALILPQTVGAFTNSATTSSIILRPTADAGVNTASPAGNFGTSHAFMDIGNKATGSTWQGLMKFDVSSIPSNATVTSALLRIYMYAGLCTGSTQAVDFRTVGSNWSETTVTWNNKPSPSFLMRQDIYCHQGQNFSREFEITSTVSKWRSGELPNYGLNFAPADGNTWWIEFMSREAYNYPILTVNYTIPFTVTIPTTSGSVTTDSLSPGASQSSSAVAGESGSSSAAAGGSGTEIERSAHDLPADASQNSEEEAKTVAEKLEKTFNDAKNGSSNSLMWILLALIVLVLALATTSIVFWRKHKKLAKKSHNQKD